MFPEENSQLREEHCAQCAQEQEADQSHLNATQEAEGRNIKEGNGVNTQIPYPVLCVFQLG